MMAIGLDHRTRELAGFHRATMASDSTRDTGRETAAVLNTITTGIAIATAISANTNGTVITTEAANGKIDSRLPSSA
jgi:hypothetical protein